VISVVIPTCLAKEAGAFALGLLPMLVVVGFFKLRLTPPNDLMSTVGAGETLARVTDPQRYGSVAKAYLTGILSFGFNGLVSAVPLSIAMDSAWGCGGRRRARDGSGWP
jgi:hypothetical protein